MLRAKKKAEQAAQQAAAASAAAATGEQNGATPMEVAPEGGGGVAPGATEATGGGAAAEAKADGTISILGIGGQSVKPAQQPKGRRRQPAELRIQKDLSEVEVGTVATIDVPNPNDLTLFHVDMTPESGMWAGAKYRFQFKIPAEYPHTPPKVTCLTRILHPNIDFEGNVCLNILRQEWKPILDINTIIYGLLHLFLEPNPDDPLNKEAADLFRSNPRSFENTVRQTLRGGSYQGHSFDRLVKY